jgi:hypothetical protein
LVQLLLVEKCKPNPDFDPSRPPHAFKNPRFLLDVQDTGAEAINPPLLIEDIIYPDGRELPPTGPATGMRLQAPRILTDNTVRVLKACLKEAPYRLNIV